MSVAFENWMDGLALGVLGVKSGKDPTRMKARVKARLPELEKARAIIQATGVVFEMDPAIFIGTRKTRGISEPRALAMHLVWRHTALSLPWIGRIFQKHHTTVLLADRRMEQRLKWNAGLREHERLIREACGIESASICPGCSWDGDGEP